MTIDVHKLVQYLYKCNLHLELFANKLFHMNFLSARSDGMSPLSFGYQTEASKNIMLNKVGRIGWTLHLTVSGSVQ